MAIAVVDKMQERKQRESQTRQDQILAVVKRLIKQGGAREVSIRRVADMAGFSTTVVYTHFKDKATLITRAMDADLLALVATMKSAAAHTHDAEEKLKLAGRAYVDYGLRHTDEYALVFMEVRPHAPNEAAQVEHGNAEQDPYAFAFGLMSGFASSCLGFPSDDTTLTPTQLQTLHLMTQMYWQGLHGLVSLNIVMGPNDPWTPHMLPAHNAQVLVDVILLGLKQRFSNPD